MIFCCPRGSCSMGLHEFSWAHNSWMSPLSTSLNFFACTLVTGPIDTWTRSFKAVPWSPSERSCRWWSCHQNHRRGRFPLWIGMLRGGSGSWFRLRVRSSHQFVVWYPHAFFGGTRWVFAFAVGSRVAFHLPSWHEGVLGPFCFFNP